MVLLDILYNTSSIDTARLTETREYTTKEC